MTSSINLELVFCLLMAIYKLNQVATIKRGCSPRPINYWLKNQGLMWAKISDLEGNYLYKTKQFIDPAWENKALIGKYGDLLITNSATPGVPFIQLTEKVAYHDGFLLINCKEQMVYKKFLFYKLILDKPKLIKMGNGAVFVNLSSVILKNWNIFLPNISEQQKIIDIIEPLEQLENNFLNQNNQINILLKNIKTTNQKFKLETILEPIKNPEKGIKQVSAKILIKNNTMISELEKKGTYSTNSFFCPEGTFLFCSIRTYLQKYCILPFDADVNGTLFQFKVKENFTSLLKALNNKEFWEKTNLLSSGTKMPIISRKDFLNIEINKTIFEIENLDKLLIIQNKILIKLNNLKKCMVHLLIK